MCFRHMTFLCKRHELIKKTIFTWFPLSNCGMGSLWCSKWVPLFFKILFHKLTNSLHSGHLTPILFLDWWLVTSSQIKPCNLVQSCEKICLQTTYLHCKHPQTRSLQIWQLGQKAYPSQPVLSGNHTSSLNFKIFKNQEADVIKISKNPEDWIKPIGYLSWEKNQEIWAGPCLGNTLLLECYYPTLTICVYIPT